MGSDAADVHRHIAAFMKDLPCSLRLFPMRLRGVAMAAAALLLTACAAATPRGAADGESDDRRDVAVSEDVAGDAALDDVDGVDTDPDAAPDASDVTPVDAPADDAGSTDVEPDLPGAIDADGDPEDRPDTTDDVADSTDAGTDTADATTDDADAGADTEDAGDAGAGDADDAADALADALADAADTAADTDDAADAIADVSDTGADTATDTATDTADAGTDALADATDTADAGADTADTADATADAADVADATDTADAIADTADAADAADTADAADAADAIADTADVADAADADDTTDAAGDADADPDGGLGPCVAQTYAPSTLQRPVDIIWSIDASPSMDEEIAHIESQLAAFAERIGGSGADYRVILIGSDRDQWIVAETRSYYGICVPPPLSGADACPDVDSERYLHVREPVYSREVLQDLIATADQWVPALRPDAVKHIILVTDDDERRTTGDDLRALVASEPAFGDELYVHSIVDFIGYDPDCIFDESRCSCGERRGQTYLDLSADTAGLALSVCDEDWTPIFDALGTAVVSTVEIPCQFDVPFPGDGFVVEFGAVSVRVPGPDGGDVPRVTGPDACGPDGGWYFDFDDLPTRLYLCPATCGTSTEGLEVELECVREDFSMST